MIKKHYYHHDILKICKDVHLTADEVFAELKKKYLNVWISTVYRNFDVYLIKF